MLKVLRYIVQEIEGAESFSDALDIIVRRVRESLETDSCAIYLADADKNEFVLMAADGLNHEQVGHARFPLTKGLVGLVSSTKKTL